MNETVNTILAKISQHILTPILGVMFLMAFVWFVYGVFRMIVGAGDVDKRKEGQQNVLWGVIGMFIMVSAYGIIRLIANTLEVTPPF